MCFFMQELKKYSWHQSTMVPLIQNKRKQLREVELEFNKEFFLLSSLSFLFQIVLLWKIALTGKNGLNAGKWGVIHPPYPQKENENILKFSYLLQGTLHPGISLEIHKSHKVFRSWSIFPSDFKVTSASVQVLLHLGCPSEVSSKKMTKAEATGNVRFARDSNICCCGAATMWNNFRKSGTKLLLRSSKTPTRHESKNNERIPTVKQIIKGLHMFKIFTILRK